MSRHPYQYVVLRCVPRVEREEFLNVGVVVYCQETNFLAASWTCNTARLQAMDPVLDIDRVCDALAYVEGVCAGDPAVGVAGRGDLGTRFGFVKAPRSTVLQPGPVHGGLTEHPGRELERLLQRYVG